MSNHFNRLYEFENFRLDTENPGLWRDGELVAIAPKVLETLILLVERGGEIVSREELLEKVWKETFVEEGNINYTVSRLRKILGEKNLIQTVPKRGYRFVGKIESVSIEEISDEDASGIIKILPEIENLTSAIEAENLNRVSSKPRSNYRWAVFAVVLTGILFVTVTAFRSSHKTNAVSPDDKIAENLSANAEAKRAYMRGKMILDDRDSQKRAEKAIEEFQSAITLDPTLAAAHAGLAEALTLSANSSTDEKAADFYAKAHIAVNKALSLDENLAEAYLTRGLIRRNGEWNWKGAIDDFRRATEIKPDYALAHVRYAHILAPLGKHNEALAEANKAYALDPLSEAVLTGHFAVLESRGEYDEAVRKAEDFLRVNPDNALANRALATFLYHKGEYAKVIELGEKVFEKNQKRKPFAWLSLVAASYRKIGQIEKSDPLLHELEMQSETDSKALYSLAMNYAESESTDEAVAALEKCLAAREERMVWVKVEPRFTALRQNAGFQAIIEKMNF
jgi:DNA-binding winged helix-turn-helix (wHTH) protein/cytochrome c-type biogenesis protein CcmH/NrfG